MKISETGYAYAPQTNGAAVKKAAQTEEAAQTEKTTAARTQDRLEIQRDRSRDDKAGEISALQSELENSNKQCEAMQKGTEEFAKIMEIMRRISRGDKVPARDERKLLEYSDKMYQMAKLQGANAHNLKPKKHKSLWEDEDETAGSESPAEGEGETSASAVSPAPSAAEVVEAAAEGADIAAE